MAALSLDKSYLPPVVETNITVPLIKTNTFRVFGVVLTITRTVK